MYPVNRGRRPLHLSSASFFLNLPLAAFFSIDCLCNMHTWLLFGMLCGVIVYLIISIVLAYCCQRCLTVCSCIGLLVHLDASLFFVPLIVC